MGVEAGGICGVWWLEADLKCGKVCGSGPSRVRERIGADGNERGEAREKEAFRVGVPSCQIALFQRIVSFRLQQQSIDITFATALASTTIPQYRTIVPV